MATILIQKRNLTELARIATVIPNENESIRILNRLLSGAAEEQISISFLILRIQKLDDLLDRFRIRYVRKMVSELLTILVQQTPDELYVDCLGYNEFLLLLPGVSKEETCRVGREIHQRFLHVEKNIHPSSDLGFELIGCVFSFPEDGKNWVELLCQARDTLSLNYPPGENIRLIIPLPLQSYSLELTEIAFTRLRRLAEHLGFSESFLFRQALDEFLHQYE